MKIDLMAAFKDLFSTEEKEVEDFDFNFFGDYLKIGLWPVLAVLVMLLVAMPFIFVAMLPMMFAPAFGQENEGLMIGLALIGMLVYFAVIIALTLFSYPVLLRSGLMMDSKAGFSKEFVFSFVKKSRLGSYRLLYPRGTDFLAPHDHRISRAHHRSLCSRFNPLGCDRSSAFPALRPLP